MSPAGRIGSFGSVLRGEHERLRGVVLSQSASIDFESEEAMPVTLDGELTDLTTPLRVDAWPGALTVLARAA
jgi:diacylglycerol kinase family enzyme